MRLVLNSNVIIAAFATQGICLSLLEHCLYAHNIFFSEDLLKEISIKLQTKIKVPKQLVREIISFLKNHATTVSPRQLEQNICRCPNVDNVISLAMTVKSDYVISGESDLMALKQHKSVTVLSPRDFWKVLQKQGKESPGK
jgi:putative PIN family toxin of toxin-antitoxin system